MEKGLENKYSSRLLELALKAQSSQFDFVIMPHMTKEESENVLENLKYSTTLAYGKTSHKVTRRYLKNDLWVNASDISVPEAGEMRNYAKGLRILTKLERKQKKIVINELYNHKVSVNLENKERKLKLQLLLSKLNSVISKKIDLIKFSSFNEIKLHCIKQIGISKSSKEVGNLFSIQDTSKNITRNRQEGCGTDVDFKQTRSTNWGYMYNSSSNINISNSLRPNHSILRKGLHKLQLSTSLIGNAIFQEQIAIENKEKKNEDFDYSNLSNSLLISESSNKSISNKEAEELDDYLSKRLSKLEEVKHQKESSKAVIKEQSKVSKPASKEKIVLYDDTEYEYILESEEDEDEDSESEDQTWVDNIFSRSFLEENGRTSEVQPFQRGSVASSIEPFQLASNIPRTSMGSMRNTITRRSEVKENGKILQIEERKEDSYIHPALENSIFSNISGIFGKQAINNNLMSWKDDSFEDDWEELEFKSDFKESKQNTQKKTRHIRMRSAVETLAEKENAELHKEKNIQHIKEDIDTITKDLERIRDLVLNNPAAKEVFDSIYEESQNKSKADKSNK